MEITLNSINNNTANYTHNGENFSRKIRSDKSYPYFVHNRLVCAIDLDNNNISIMNSAVKDNSFVPASLNQPAQSEFDINERFSFLENFTDMVIENITPSLLVTGSGGLGKSHTVKQQLLKNNLVETSFSTIEVPAQDDEGNSIVNVTSQLVGDYTIIKGYATPKALFKALYENSDKLIIFDDCDSVLKDATALNILKGALEINKTEDRIISWLSQSVFDDGLPNSFKFTGRVIFISNLPLYKIDQAITSRAIPVDLSMSTQDKIDRMKNILPDILPEYDISLKSDVLDFIEEYAFEAKDLNMRTLQKCCHVKFKYGDNPAWKSAAKYLLVNN